VLLIGKIHGVAPHLLGLIPLAFIPYVLVKRLLNEEKLLRGGLDGYDEYMQKVRYRLIPFVW